MVPGNCTPLPERELAMWIMWSNNNNAKNLDIRRRFSDCHIATSLSLTMWRRGAVRLGPGRRGRGARAIDHAEHDQDHHRGEQADHESEHKISRHSSLRR